MLSPFTKYSTLIHMIHLLEDNYFIGYGQRNYKISSTIMSNTGINRISALRLRGLICQARPQGAEDGRIIVDQAIIDALRMQIPVLREDSMRWVDDFFEVAARNVYNAVGRPPLDNLLSDCQEIFGTALAIFFSSITSTMKYVLYIFQVVFFFEAYGRGTTYQISGVSLPRVFGRSRKPIEIIGNQNPAVEFPPTLSRVPI